MAKTANSKLDLVTQYSYDYSNVISNCKPVQPCMHCSNPQHWDKDFSLYQKDPSRAKKACVDGKEKSYSCAYQAMMEGQEIEYMRAYLAYLDGPIADSSILEDELVFDTATDNEIHLGDVYIASEWVAMQAVLKPGELPPLGRTVLEFTLPWEQPPGKFALGQDAFKIRCWINSSRVNELTTPPLGTQCQHYIAFQSISRFLD